MFVKVWDYNTGYVVNYELSPIAISELLPPGEYYALFWIVGPGDTTADLTLSFY